MVGPQKVRRPARVRQRAAAIYFADPWEGAYLHSGPSLPEGQGENPMRNHTGQIGLLDGPDLSHLSVQERAILEDLMDRPGRGGAITGRELGRLFGISGSEVRGIVHRLREVGLPIGSSSVGYWFCTSPEEIRETAAHLRSRIRKISHALAAIEGKPLEELAGQLRLWLIHDAVTSPPKDTGRRPDWGGDDVESHVEDPDNPEE